VSCTLEVAVVALGGAGGAAGGGALLALVAGGERCHEALARLLLLLDGSGFGGGSCLTLRVRVEELDSDFACDLPLLPEELELDFSSSFLSFLSFLSLFERVLENGLVGWLLPPPSPCHLSRFRQRLLSLKPLLGPELGPESIGPGDCIIGSGKKNACAGPALPAVTTRVAAKTIAAPWIGRMRMMNSLVGMSEFLFS
jgi:hypothetical protein